MPGQFNESGRGNVSRYLEGKENDPGPGTVNLGQAMGHELAGREMAARKHHVPAQGYDDGAGTDKQRFAGEKPANLPAYYNLDSGGPGAPYSAPSELKEHLELKSAIRQGASMETQPNGGRAVIRTDPISPEEIAYLKSMKDQTELAKFDDYVETFIDPRMPGNMKWLMEIYPDFVNRRLEQAHTEYEYAMRNQMIDSWGINTFDDLHFKYLVDQGKVTGPKLSRAPANVNSSYSPGWLSPFNFKSPNLSSNQMALPFSSAQYGKKPAAGTKWNVNRENRPLGQGNTTGELASGMYAPVSRRASFAASAPVGGGLRA